MLLEILYDWAFILYSIKTNQLVLPQIICANISLILCLGGKLLVTCQLICEIGKVFDIFFLAKLYSATA